MNKVCFLFLFGTILSCLGQNAQDAPPGNPTQFPSGNSAWTIDISQKNPGGATAAAAGRMQKVDITLLDDVQRIIITWVGGKTTERWHYNSLKLTFDTNTTNGDPVGIKDWNLAFVPKTGFEAIAFSWINPSNFQGTESYQGKNCYHYKTVVKKDRNGAILTGPGQVFSSPTMEAWIDKQTSLPVGLDDGSQLGVFTFQKNPPAGPLTPPKPVQDAYLRYSVPLVPPPPPKPVE